MGVKPRWNKSLIMGILLIAAFAFIGSLCVNRYRLVNDGQKRIDTITGRVWLLRTELVFDEERAMEYVSDFRKQSPDYKDKSDSELVELIRDFNISRNLTKDAKLYCMRRESHWELVSE